MMTGLVSINKILYFITKKNHTTRKYFFKSDQYFPRLAPLKIQTIFKSINICIDSLMWWLPHLNIRKKFRLHFQSYHLVIYSSISIEVRHH